MKLRRVVLVRPRGQWRTTTSLFLSLEDLVEKSVSLEVSNEVLSIASRSNTADVCNMQFTSGTTGNPKAALLTHQ
jgi:long-subunit acyl-CoA synthetase (AMP-forming)